jgi:hypothetical protein
VHHRNNFYDSILNSEVSLSFVHSVCVVTGVSVTCNNELCLHLYMDHVDAIFYAVECVFTFFGAVCVLFCCFLCS